MTREEAIQVLESMKSEENYNALVDLCNIAIEALNNSIQMSNIQELQAENGSLKEIVKFYREQQKYPIAEEYANTMTYKQAIGNIWNGKGIAYRKTTMKKLHELAEIADKLVLCKDCKNYSVEGKTTQFGWCNALEMPTDEQRFCADGKRSKE